jgi:hypothetical protein
VPRMACTFVAPLFIVAFGVKETPTDDEWRGYRELVRRHCVDGMAQIITTQGACPTRDQRRDLDELLDGRPVATAFLSDPACEIALAALLSTSGGRFKAFRLDQLREALAFLGPAIPLDLTVEIARELDRLRGEVGQRSPS